MSAVRHTVSMRATHVGMTSLYRMVCATCGWESAACTDVDDATRAGRWHSDNAQPVTPATEAELEAAALAEEATFLSRRAAARAWTQITRTAAAKAAAMDRLERALRNLGDR